MGTWACIVLLAGLGIGGASKTHTIHVKEAAKNTQTPSCDDGYFLQGDECKDWCKETPKKPVQAVNVSKQASEYCEQLGSEEMCNIAFEYASSDTANCEKDHWNVTECRWDPSQVPSCTPDYQTGSFDCRHSPYLLFDKIKDCPMCKAHCHQACVKDTECDTNFFCGEFFTCQAKPCSEYMCPLEYDLDEEKINSTDYTTEGCCQACKGNRFPGSSTKVYNLTGLKQHEEALKLSGLKDKDWQIGKKWMLQVSATSHESREIQLGFAGSYDGFSVLAIPPKVTGKKITVIGTVVSTIENTEFEVRSQSPREGVSLTGICLRPLTCGEAFHGHCDSGLKPTSADRVGSTKSECCEQLTCEHYNCSSDTTFKKRSDSASHLGDSDQECCVEVYCKDHPTICDGTQWKDKTGNGWRGSTQMECCEQQLCAKYTCSDNDTWSPLPAKMYQEGHGQVDRLGSTDEECCTKQYCKDFACEPSTKWSPRADFTEHESKEIRGSSHQTCCEAKDCKDYVCSIHTKWSHLPPTNSKGQAFLGSTDAECCTPNLCQDWPGVCDTGYSKAHPSSLGNTSDECCEKRPCSEYLDGLRCSDMSKWMRLSNHHTNDDSPRLGFSDEECCEPIRCSNNVQCSPTSKWTPKPNQSMVVGGEIEECCDPIWCTDYECQQKTKYTIKSNLTNIQGHSDEECCEPLYCKDFVILEPTKFRRIDDDDRLGSSTADCTQTRYCSNHHCTKGALIGEAVMGSTDCECCDDSMGSHSDCPT
eukprot:TRINITY_DN61391_c0_g1_i1.p1 TRINITY_DN61391_c0_g1~~TRINITY_DN61391_c0_g1_i1.p1  ORF type:complete len:758 (+),score=112.14 TRINITY_DN61391_c0_g1_i1:103-2376(+)